MKFDKKIMKKDITFNFFQISSMLQNIMFC